MGLQRLIALIMFAVGLYLLGRDAATMLADTGHGPEALDALWRRLDASSLSSVQAFVETHLPRSVWDPGVAAILRLPAWSLPLGFGGGLLLLSLLRTAWLTDDAFITFRTADNILNGYGPVWNVSERVQTFTHPLWLGLCTLAFGLTGNVYYTAIALSVALTFVCVWILGTRLAPTPQRLVLCFAAMLSSKAWIDYSTSGLENPLTHLLVLVFAWQWYDAPPGGARVRRLSLLGALCALNRLDLILIVAPALVVETYRHGLRASVRPLVESLLPLAAWEAFSVFYYGTPFPNTAYAKLNTAFTFWIRLQRGEDYVLRTLTDDPTTLPTMALASLATWHTWRRSESALLAGLLLYVAYVISIGGDFMMGRFFSAPFAVSLAILARAPYPRAAVVTAVGLLGIGLLAPWEPALLSGSGYAFARARLFGPATASPFDRIPYLEERHVFDERRYYYETSGMLKVGLRNQVMHGWAADGLDARARGRQVVVLGPIGFFGYYAGPEVHIIDDLALADPLLSRIPGGAADSIAGHFKRQLPRGYLETVRDGSNRLKDPDLAAYYDALHMVTAGPLLSSGRLLVLGRWLAGSYDHHLHRYLESTRPK